MKYLALALTLLFALGSHAASLETMMADAPSQLDQIRSAVGMYLTQVKDHTKKALDHLDDTEYKTYKVQLSSSLDDLAVRLHDYQQQAAPHTDTIVAQVSEALAPLHAAIQADIDALKAELEPKRAKLREVLDKHLEDYKLQIEPLATELATKWAEESAAMRAKIQPIADQLSAKIAVNVEETKAALIPIVQVVSEKLMERVKNLQEMAKPYYDEYKEHVNKAIDDLRANAGTLDAERLRSQVAPHLTELSSNPAFVQVKAKVEEIYQTIHDAINKAA